MPVESVLSWTRSDSIRCRGRLTAHGANLRKPDSTNISLDDRLIKIYSLRQVDRSPFLDDLKWPIQSVELGKMLFVIYVQSEIHTLKVKTCR